MLDCIVKLGGHLVEFAIFDSQEKLLDLHGFTGTAVESLELRELFFCFLAITAKPGDLGSNEVPVQVPGPDCQCRLYMGAGTGIVFDFKIAAC